MRQASWIGMIQSLIPPVDRAPVISRIANIGEGRADFFDLDCLFAIHDGHGTSVVAAPTRKTSQVEVGFEQVVFQPQMGHEFGPIPLDASTILNLFRSRATLRIEVCTLRLFVRVPGRMTRAAARGGVPAESATSRGTRTKEIHNYTKRRHEQECQGQERFGNKQLTHGVEIVQKRDTSMSTAPQSARATAAESPDSLTQARA
jgi:hypothetical protein